MFYKESPIYSFNFRFENPTGNPVTICLLQGLSDSLNRLKKWGLGADFSYCSPTFVKSIVCDTPNIDWSDLCLLLNVFDNPKVIGLYCDYDQPGLLLKSGYTIPPFMCESFDFYDLCKKLNKGECYFHLGKTAFLAIQLPPKSDFSFQIRIKLE